VRSQTILSIVHTRMKVGMERYERQYPGADILLFEPDREDADMFFASIFSYAQRRKLCALAFAATRSSLRARADAVVPALARYGIAVRRDRLADATRSIKDALCDPRPLKSDPRRAANVRRTTRDLAHALDHLERYLAAAR
jgi:hypothetical protein